VRPAIKVLLFEEHWGGSLPGIYTRVKCDKQIAEPDVDS
jgi:hypothetical protein